MKADIARAGVQVPVICRPHPDKPGFYDMLAGARRWSIAKELKLPAIPANIHPPLTDAEAFEITRAENFGREDLTPLEECRAVQIMLEQYAGDVKAVASALGITEIAVRQRAKARDLSPAWLKAMADPEHLASRLTAAHIALVARLEKPVQDAFLEDKCEDNYYDDAVPTIKDFTTWIASYTRNLSGARWDKADEDLVAGAGTCYACPKRSDSQGQMGLWEVKAASQNNALCLDKACWEKKAAAYVARILKEKQAAGSKAVLVIDSDADYQERRELQQLHHTRNEVDVGHLKAKPSPGATEVLVVNGPKVGQVLYQPKPKADDCSGDPDLSRAQPKTMKQKRAELEKKRWAVTIQELAKKVEKAPWTGSDLTLIALAAAFGTDETERYFCPGSWARVFNGIDKKNVEALYQSVRSVICCRLSYNGPITQTPDELIKEARQAAKFFKIDLDAIFKEACDAVPEPKSWIGGGGE